MRRAGYDRSGLWPEDERFGTFYVVGLIPGFLEWPLTWTATNG